MSGYRNGPFGNQVEHIAALAAYTHAHATVPENDGELWDAMTTEWDALPEVERKAWLRSMHAVIWEARVMPD